MIRVALSAIGFGILTGFFALFHYLEYGIDRQFGAGFLTGTLLFVTIFLFTGWIVPRAYYHDADIRTLAELEGDQEVLDRYRLQDERKRNPRRFIGYAIVLGVYGSVVLLHFVLPG